MRTKFVNAVVLMVGVSLGVYISSKLNILTDVSVVGGGSTSESVLQGGSESAGEVNKYRDNLVLVESVYDGFEIDLRYATDNNITGSILYDKPLCFLQKSTLDKLIQANEELRLSGYKIKIWDAYRPLQVQKKLWAVYPNSTYIANPFTNGSNHNRGAAVDITLVDLYGNPVEMPSDFDEFGSKANRDYTGNKEASKKVDMLTEIMHKYGFNSISSEWWHFDDSDCREYSVKDYDFRELMKM